MGGVLPPFRQKGVAAQLAKVQELWVRQQGFRKVVLKTRNCHRGMLIFALKNGFQITNILPKKEIKDYRIILEKQLIN